MIRSVRSALLAAAGSWVVLHTALPAAACGGFFCSTAQPVNQAAERIVFADNGDGTVTAVIEIQYQGDSSEFSWLLPIATAPAEGQIQVASNLAFQRLQSATNPLYNLTTRVEGSCKAEARNASLSADFATSAPGAGAAESINSDVNVEASGSVGPFDWTVISVTEGTPEPAEEAVAWLTANGYDVPDGAATLLGPYLEDGLFLLALRLTKDADVGSIRPIVLTYEADRAMIPVKLTAVAANEDMGVMTWLLGKGRGVPENYLALEINEARINWFNAASTYNDVVIEAADDAGGQGFVTEFAGAASEFAGVVWQDWEMQLWDTQQEQPSGSLGELFQTMLNTWGSYDGFWDAVRASVTLPDQVNEADVRACPSCYAEMVQFSPSEFLAAIESNVIEPMRVIQDLLDVHPKLTRLYTTLSAEEMTLDPLFTFNEELPNLSNVHNAERVIECNPNITQAEASWRIELPQGGRVRGTPEDANLQAWPAALSALPPNFTIQRHAATGAGRVIEDNSENIELELAEYNSSVPRPGEDDGWCSVARHFGGPSASGWGYGSLAGLASVLLLWGRRRTAR
jgi:hypothetical protein